MTTMHGCHKEIFLTKEVSVSKAEWKKGFM